MINKLKTWENKDQPTNQKNRSLEKQVQRIFVKKKKAVPKY